MSWGHPYDYREFLIYKSRNPNTPLTEKVQKDLDSRLKNFNSLNQRFNSLEDVVHM